MTIAVVSVLISSVALVGVATGLLLQARQVRVSQIQAVRLAQLELMKMALENSSIVAGIAGISGPVLFSQRVYLNWEVKYHEMGYEINYFSDAAIRQVQSEFSIPRLRVNGGHGPGRCIKRMQRRGEQRNSSLL